MVIMNPPRNPSKPGATLEPSKNGEMLTSDILNDTSNQYYHRHDVAHATEVKYENNRYTTLLNVEFGSTESDSTVNITSKYRKLFTIITNLDPSSKIITDDDTIIHHPKEFPMEADYATNLTIINDRIVHFQRFLIRYVIDSTRILPSMKQGDDNIEIIL